MRRIRILYLLLFLYAVLTACSPEKPEETQETPLEAFVDDNQEEQEKMIENPYDYLYPCVLKNQDLSLTVYLPEASSNENPTDTAKASAGGITINARLTPAATDPQQMIDQELKELKEQKNVQGIERNGTEDGVNTDLTVIQYFINNGKNELYPCLRAIKQKRVSEDYTLDVVIDINNMLAEEQSADILAEVAEAYGIRINGS